MDSSDLTQASRLQLRETLNSAFNEDELRTLCFDLAVDYDSLSGTSKESKSRELLSYMLRAQRLEELIGACQVRRPNINWRALIDRTTTPTPPVPDSGRSSSHPMRTIGGALGLLGLLAAAGYATYLLVNSAPPLSSATAAATATLPNTSSTVSAPPATVNDAAPTNTPVAALSTSTALAAPTTVPAPAVTRPPPRRLPTDTPAQDCAIAWFFKPNTEPVDGLCPTAKQASKMATQPFERGKMLWLAGQTTIRVLTNRSDGRWNYRDYADTWSVGQPISDSAVVAPPNLFQPILGFGKIWREHQLVNSLGWATREGESAYEADLQSGGAGSNMREFMRVDGQLLSCVGSEDQGVCEVYSIQ